ncbi:MAG: hypothetical protein P4L40_05335, partial [Terracidiphilus sp.]|nr:hypothetical protein [Terracidiphilus sp.]
LGSTVRGASYDSRVFALAILLSSTFIYNSTGVIDGDALARLSLVVNLTKHIHVRSSSAEVSACRCMSSFAALQNRMCVPACAARRWHGIRLRVSLLHVGGA